MQISSQHEMTSSLVEKINSGNGSEWSNITQDNGLIFLDYPNISQNLQVRDEILYNMCMFTPLTYCTMQTPPFTLKQVQDYTILASSNSILFSNNDIITIKMWGFSGITMYSDPFLIYSNAIYALLNGDETRGIKGLRNLINDYIESSGGAEPSILLHFDGDPACEKKDNKMSHCIFAPMVAKILKRELGLPIHLMIIKIDKDEVSDIYKKFVDKDEDNYTMRLVSPKNGPPQHFYPNFTNEFFESCTIYAEKVSSTKDSEVKTSSIITSLLGERIKARCCLCVGSNSQNGVLAMAEQGAAKFDLVVRSHLYAMFKPN